MKRLAICTVLLFLFVLTSCKKETYPVSQVVNDPVFYFKGDVAGQPVSFSAGKDNYYMFSSVAQDNNNVYNFLGTLKQNNCSNCANSLFFQINDYQTSTTNGPTNIDMALKPGVYPFFVDREDSVRVEFKSTYNKIAASYSWDFGDGQTSTDADPIHIYAKKGKYTITLKIQGQGANGCVSTISYSTKIGYTNSSQTSISSTPLSANSIAFSQTSTGVNPLSYFWDFGDGFTSTQSNPQHSYAVKGAYPVKLRVIDALGDTAMANYNAYTQSDVSSCAANFKIVNVTPIGNQTRLGLSTATIKWVDASGKLFTSSDLLQPDSSSFEILSVEDYEVNENNLRTKKIKVKIKCTVYNGQESIRIDNAEAVIAVAYH